MANPVGQQQTRIGTREHLREFSTEHAVLTGARPTSVLNSVSNLAACSNGAKSLRRLSRHPLLGRRRTFICIKPSAGKQAPASTKQAWRSRSKVIKAPILLTAQMQPWSLDRKLLFNVMNAFAVRAMQRPAYFEQKQQSVRNSLRSSCLPALLIL